MRHAGNPSDPIQVPARPPRRFPGATALRRAFTLIELLMVIAVLAILMGLVFIGLGDTLEWAKVNRSAYSLAAAMEEAKQVAAARSLHHMMVFNSVKDPRLLGERETGFPMADSAPAYKTKPGDQGVDPENDQDEADFVFNVRADTFNRGFSRRTLGQNPWIWKNDDGSDALGDSDGGASESTVKVDFLDSTATYHVLGTVYYPGNGKPHPKEQQPPHAFHTRRHASRLLSRKPEDQWFATFGPWRDSDGIWRQALGGVVVKGVHMRETLETPPRGRLEPNMENSSSHVSQIGGVFSYPKDVDGFIPNNLMYTVDPQNAVWDPYEVMLGSRRYLESGTRWLSRPDCPWWNPDPGATIMFKSCGIPMVAGRGILGGGDSSFATVINFMYNGLIDTNFCEPTNQYSYFVQRYSYNTNDIAGDFDNTPGKYPEGPYNGGGKGYLAAQVQLGICSQKTRTAEYLDRGDGISWQFERPVAVLFLTVTAVGQVIVDVSPITNL